MSNSHSYDDTNLDLLQTKLKEGCMSAWKEWSSIGVANGEVFTKLKQLRIDECNKLCYVDWPDNLPCLRELVIEGGYGSEVVLESSLPRTPSLRRL
ncbi:hypothetical protein FEM48_Zijuj10G0016000 [Ziziphus jujuba var. spinosa]|uniref:Uncharacterized protein n=1 Tax=Ziziphus jujuba var. spinosa TaxID=714518 RepID=A0A978UKI6_ZIZJJ|nr:hypothetical protein FEM48_Zijuj10G0016000 [Ziziphus jujuba var. spinosa]